MRSRDSLLRLHRFRVEDIRRQVEDMGRMVNDLMRKHDELDQHVKFEESRNGISDPNNVNYSMAAKAVRSRRDNILKSVGDLKDQHSAMQSKFDEESAELRKVELLAEKDGGGLKSLSSPGASSGAGDIPSLQA
jgi:flagellar protein FliJ